MCGIFSHNGNADLVFGVAQALQKIVPVVQNEGIRLEIQVVDDQLIELIVHQAEGNLVNGKVLVFLLNHGIDGNIAKQGNFLTVRPLECTFSTADQNIRLDANFTQLTDRMLCRFGLELPSRLEIGDKRQVDVKAILFFHIERKLTDCFEKRLAFDVTDSATDLRNHHIRVVVRQLRNNTFNLVRNMRNDLYRLSKKFTAPFLIDNRLVDLPCRII